MGFRLLRGGRSRAICRGMPTPTKHRDAAVLLLHGFGGEPYEMQGLEGVFQAEGFPVSVPLLPGHGTSVDDWCTTDFHDWAAAAHDAYADLARQHKAVFVMGLSMGGTLALHIAQRFDPAGIVTMAAPLFLYRLYPFVCTDWRLPFIPLLKSIRPMWPTSRRRPESVAIAPWRGYEGVMALGPLHSLLTGMRSTRRRLMDVRAPLLVIQGEGDRTVPQENAWEIITKVRSCEREVRLLPISETVTSRHVLTTHRETRPVVERLARDFVLRRLER